MTRDKINAIGLSVGLTSRLQTETEADLSEYLYAFAEAIYAEGQRAMQELAANHCEQFSLVVLESEWANGYAAALKDAACGIRAMEVKP